MARILLINDEPDLLFVCAFSLEQAGHVVETLTGGARVPATIKRFHPDVIGLDWVMPETSGEAVLCRLKADPDTASIPIVVISALEGLDDHARRLGADEVLHKPFTTRELRTAVDRALSSHAVDGAGERR